MFHIRGPLHDVVALILLDLFSVRGILLIFWIVIIYCIVHLQAALVAFGNTSCLNKQICMCTTSC